MKREVSQIIEIPQNEPDALQKIVFWLALRRKEVLIGAAAALAVMSGLVFWQSRSESLPEKLSFVYKSLKNSSWDEASTPKVKKAISQIGFLKESLAGDLLQKEIFHSKKARLNSSEVIGDGIYKEFSEITLLVTKDEKEEALQKTVALAEKLATSSQKKEMALRPYNLLRLYQLYLEAGRQDLAAKTLRALMAVIKSEEGKEFEKQFAILGVSLVDWINQRETR